jgi:hypothetical protein
VEGLGSCVLFYWLAAALGDRLLRLIRAPLSQLTSWERGVVSAAIGTGALQIVPLALAAAGRLHPLEVRIAMGALAVALAGDLWRVARATFRGIAALPRARRSPQEIVWALLFATMMGLLLIRAVTFAELGDDDGIHLATPRRWLAAGTLSYLPSYSLTNATLGFDMVYLIALACFNHVAAKALHFGAGIFTFLALMLCARRLSRPLAGFLVISLLLIATPVLDVPVVFANAMIDLGACWLTVTSALLWLAWRDKPDRRLLVCMALCAGFAASYKLTSIQVAMAWIPILAFESRRRGESWRSVLGSLVLFGVLAVAPVLPWFARNAINTGNPLYPMFTQWIPSRDWPPELAVIFARYVKYYAWGVAAGSKLGEPQRKLLVTITLLLVALGGTAVAITVRRRRELSLLVVFATLFVLISVQLTGLTFRYWMPALLCLALVPAALYADTPASRRFGLWPASLLLVIALVVQPLRKLQVHSHAGVAGDLRVALGLTSFDDEYGAMPLVQIWKAINADTPPDARVLLASFYTTIGSSSFAGFWIDRMCYTTDAHLQGFLPLRDFDAFVAAVSREHITHVVVADERYSPDRLGFSFPESQNEYPFALRLVREHGEKVRQAGIFGLYKLNLVPASAQPASAGKD